MSRAVLHGMQRVLHINPKCVHEFLSAQCYDRGKLFEDDIEQHVAAPFSIHSSSGLPLAQELAVFVERQTQVRTQMNDPASCLYKWSTWPVMALSVRSAIWP